MFWSAHPFASYLQSPEVWFAYLCTRNIIWTPQHFVHVAKNGNLVCYTVSKTTKNVVSSSGRGFLRRCIFLVEIA